MSTSIYEQDILCPLLCEIGAGGRIEGGAERRPEILVYIYIYMSAQHQTATVPI